MLKTMTSTKPRIAYLDGLRGVAIILVVLYHAFARWPNYFPYGSRFVDAPVIGQGAAGVFLFFMISGYVIFMTLERAPNFWSFMSHRFLRLWPAMAIASIIVFATASWFNRPHGTPALRDLVPGLTFVRPEWWARVLGSSTTDLEGSFWSLYVEMKFYVIFGGLYFLAGSRIALAALISTFLVSVGSAFTTEAANVNRVVGIVGAEFWGWFAAGAMYYKAKGRRAYLASALLISLIAAWKSDVTIAQNSDSLKLVSAFTALLFGAAMMSSSLKRVLSAQVLIFAGAISYPLYLIHENAMVSMIGSTGRIMPRMPPFFMPIIPVLILGVVAWVIATKLEPVFRQLLMRSLPKNKLV